MLQVVTKHLRRNFSCPPFLSSLCEIVQGARDEMGIASKAGDLAFKAFAAGLGVATIYLTATFSVNVYRGLAWHNAQSVRTFSPSLSLSLPSSLLFGPYFLIYCWLIKILARVYLRWLCHLRFISISQWFFIKCYWIFSAACILQRMWVIRQLKIVGLIKIKYTIQVNNWNNFTN